MPRTVDAHVNDSERETGGSADDHDSLLWKDFVERNRAGGDVGVESDTFDHTTYTLKQQAGRGRGETDDASGSRGSGSRGSGRFHNVRVGVALISGVVMYYYLMSGWKWAW